MANTYFKMLNNSIKEEFTNNIIKDIQCDLHQTSKTLKNDIFDSVKDFSTNNNDVKNIDINNLLKYYVLNQIMQDNQKTLKAEPTVVDTANPNIKKDRDNNFYKSVNGKLELVNNIKCINNDGTYTTVETKPTSSFKISKTYNKDNQLISIQVTSPNNSFAGKLEASEILGMKKVYTQKFKYSGYSGESSDLITSLLNKIYTPKETSSYMDKSCNFYKWSEAKKCFERNFIAESKSPLLTDYEFSNKIVIEKEYTGIR